MTVAFQEIIFINGFSPAMDANALAQYILSQYGNGNQIFNLPLEFPQNAVSETN